MEQVCAKQEDTQMLEVLRVLEKQDKNGKQYKQIQFLQESKFSKHHKTASLNIYGVDYLDRQDKLYTLDEGDFIDGEIVRLSVEPVITDSEIITSASVCVFIEDFTDPIQREIEIEKAFKRDGYSISQGQLKFGEQEYAFEKELFEIPKNCLII